MTTLGQGRSVWGTARKKEHFRTLRGHQMLNRRLLGAAGRTVHQNGLKPVGLQGGLKLESRAGNPG
jgi:hypothetical protein